MTTTDPALTVHGSIDLTAATIDAVVALADDGDIYVAPHLEDEADWHNWARITGAPDTDQTWSVTWSDDVLDETESVPGIVALDVIRWAAKILVAWQRDELDAQDITTATTTTTTGD